MKVLLKGETLIEAQHALNMTDQEFAEYLGISRSTLWRAKLPSEDKRFTLSQDFIACVLDRFPDKKFDDFFFLGNLSHACDKGDLMKGVS
jgi:transcriptional regulator with XRE-family HTH domain